MTLNQEDARMVPCRLKLFVLAILGVLVAAPLLRILFETLAPDAITAWSDVAHGRLS